MSSSLKTYTQETRWLLDLKLDLKQKLSSMLSFMEQEKLKLEVSSEEAHLMAQSLSRDFYEIHLLLKVYENELSELLGEAILKDLTEGNFTSDPSMLH